MKVVSHDKPVPVFSAWHTSHHSSGADIQLDACRRECDPRVPPWSIQTISHGAPSIQYFSSLLSINPTRVPVLRALLILTTMTFPCCWGPLRGRGWLINNRRSNSVGVCFARLLQVVFKAQIAAFYGCNDASLQGVSVYIDSFDVDCNSDSVHVVSCCCCGLRASLLEYKSKRYNRASEKREIGRRNLHLVYLNVVYRAYFRYREKQ